MGFSGGCIIASEAKMSFFEKKITQFGNFIILSSIKS